MNNIQLGTSTTTRFFDSLSLSPNGSYAIPDTLANVVTETTPDVVEALTKHDTVAQPALSLPQVAPERVIALRQRSLVPATSLHPLDMTTRPHSYIVKQNVVRHEQLPASPAIEWREAKVVTQTPQPIQVSHSHSTRNTPTSAAASQCNGSKLTGITYIPRSMTRHAQPTVVDALIACGTLVLLCVCVMLFLYYMSLL